jgi:hypothetical protein
MGFSEQDNKNRSVTLCVTPRCNAVKNRESRITIPLLRGGSNRFWGCTGRNLVLVQLTAGYIEKCPEVGFV